MKKLFLIVQLSLFGLFDIHAQWNTLPTPTGSTAYNDIYFTSEDVGFIARQDGIIRTTDGGQTWTNVYSGKNIKAIDFNRFNSQQGVAVGYDVDLGLGVALKTTNGGAIWTAMSIPSVGKLTGVDFNDDVLNVAVVGDTGVALLCDYFLDSDVWRKVSLGKEYTFTDVQYSGVNLMMSGAKNMFEGVVLKLNFDNNNNPVLANLAPANGTSFQQALLLAGDNLYSVGWNGTLLKRISGGSNSVLFSSLPQLMQGNVGNVDIFRGSNFNNLYITAGAASAGHIFFSSDDGQTWIDQLSNVNQPMIAGYFAPNSNTGYAIGENGLLLKTVNGGGVTSTKSTTLASLGLRAFPNPCHETLQISQNQGLVTSYQLTDLAGRSVQTWESSELSQRVNVAALPVGMYILRASNSKGAGSYKFVKE
jgi:photosystem II stability/assembly factor-like uncharacterized protein